MAIVQLNSSRTAITLVFVICISEKMTNQAMGGEFLRAKITIYRNIHIKRLHHVMFARKY